NCMRDSAWTRNTRVPGNADMSSEYRALTHHGQLKSFFLPTQFVKKFAHPDHRRLDLLKPGRVAAAHVPFAALSESGSRNHRHFFLVQQPQRKLPARQPRRTDVRKYIKRPLRLETMKPHFIQ